MNNPSSPAQVPALAKEPVVKKPSLFRTKLGLFWKDTRDLRIGVGFAGFLLSIPFIATGHTVAMTIGALAATPGSIWLFKQLRIYLAELDERARGEL